ncbi:hypothetical protein [Chroococcus sp. FPU101]|uniref:hypothetical protein n=1 Tax=Chroococcus sp. FPU101 TaxID=1974212 RepID=UPI001A8E108A|nr:hypothetical protein [Chroococcus sp. FPU101]GFE68607.1 hypothetical protein CFPU101_12170 [Chroococcus sp. FPU101]
MTRIVFQDILNQLEELEVNELEELHQIIEQYLATKEEYLKKTTFHQALLTSGLVKQIKRPIYRQTSQEQLINLEEKPISETIIEERR